ncbi:MAG: SUMF1/EgtB/PvdO family nonheme iron enzyme [Magnetococcales bacterium]|nr:SUMF1/EgtB/PvdO family nonheme iron enzyme [Magnetococcales bacterium]
METFHDADRDVLTYTARQANGTSLPSWLRFSGPTRTFSGNPPTGTNKISLMITANDGHDGVVSTTFLLNLTNANDRPTVSNPVSDRVWTGIGTKSYRIPLDTFRDGDGDTLIYSVTLSDGSALPSWLRFAASTRTLSGNPPANTATLRLRVRANDGHGSTASSYFYLSFDAFTNDAPVVSARIADQTWNRGESKSFQVPANIFSDGDGDYLTYSASLANGSSLPSWLLFNASTRTFSGSPPGDASTLALKVTADDNHGMITYTTFNLWFAGSVSNRPPSVITAIADQTWSGSGSKSFQIPANSITDDDSDTLTYSATLENGAALPAWLSFNVATRTFSGNPPADASALTLKVTANDGRGGTVQDIFVLSSETTNDAPTVATSIANQSWSGSGTKSFQVPANTFLDGDGERLTYSATQANGSALPSWLRFNAGTRTFSGNPPSGAIDRTLKVMADDGHGGTISTNFNLNMSRTNDLPRVANTIPDLVWSGSGTKSFQVSANTFTDGDGDDLTYSATLASGSALPSWLRFDTSTRTFSGNPPAGASSRTLKVIANDGHGGTVYRTFGLTFSGATNDAPRVSNAISDQTWNRNVSQSFQVPATTFSDGDRDSLTYSAKLANGSALPSWLSFSPSTRTFAGTPPTGVTSLDLRVTVNDGHGSTSSDTFSLNFPATTSNHAPVAVNDTVTTTRNQAVMDTLTATDSDADRLTYAIVSNGTRGTVVFTNTTTGAFTYTPNANVTGSDSFTYKVNDGQADSNTATVTVTINPPPNHAPVSTNGTLSVAQNTAITGTLSASDSDQDALLFSIVSNGTKGTVALTNTATGTYRYTPNSGASGSDTFTFKVNDGTTDSNTATVTVTIAATGGAEITNSLGMTFKLIPAGTFTMGESGCTSPDWWCSGSKPSHQVTISQNFYMQTTEITQGQWRAVMGNNPSYFSSCGDTCPVEQVSWNDLQTFITTLNARNEGTYRLPTEAEWEYAARAGTTTAYSFGDSESSFGNYAWYSSNSSSRTHPVAQKLPNPWGLYDMHGNVWEWVADWYGSFSSSAVTDPQGPSSGSYRVDRGGSWYDNPASLRSALRDRVYPGLRNLNLGFRLSRTYP